MMMMRLFFLFFGVSGMLYGAASSSSDVPRQGPGRIVFWDNPTGVFKGRVICQDALQNPRLTKNFPIPFTMRYRSAEGNWTCGRHYVLPQVFNYYDVPEEHLAEFNARGTFFGYDRPIVRFG